MTTAPSFALRANPAGPQHPLIARAVSRLRRGHPIIVRDDDSAELVLAAEFATTERVAELVRRTGGFVCAAMTVERCETLGLPLQYRTFPAAGVPRYCVSVDAAGGITTGISAHDRGVTLRTLAASDTQPEELCRAGHVVPVAVDLLRADGALGAQRRLTVAVLLASLAGLQPVVAASTLPDDVDRSLGTTAWPDDASALRSVVSISVDAVRTGAA